MFAELLGGLPESGLTKHVSGQENLAALSWQPCSHAQAPAPCLSVHLCTPYP